MSGENFAVGFVLGFLLCEIIWVIDMIFVDKRKRKEAENGE